MTETRLASVVTSSSVAALKMGPNLDIYRSANVLVKHQGDDALVEAAMRADAMLEAGDLDGFAVWKKL